MNKTIMSKPLMRAKRIIKLDTLVLFILFFLSGLSGLIYESAWSQQLALIFGSTELAIAAVLASYMGGLAMGASVISLFINRIKNPIIVYAIIEALIALSALSVPYLLSMVSQLYSDTYTTAELSSISPSNALTYIVGSFTVLLIPTTLMGATLPLLAKYSVRDGDNLGNKIGLLYSINTLGACGGALIAAFVLLPLFGLGMTIYIAVLINLIIFMIGLFYFRNKALDKDQTNSVLLNNKIFKNKWIFPVMFISGAVSLAYEILWTRLLSHVLGGSIYSFGVMLFVFLLAIAIGAYFGSLICKKYNPLKSFTWVQFGIAISFISSFYFANLLPDIAIDRNYGSFSFVYESLAIGLVTLFPGALFIGATFPLAINISAINNQHSGTVAARVYTWNTVGAIFGSILMGFYLLSSFGFARSSQLLSSISLLLAILVIVLSNKSLKTLVLMISCLILIWLVPFENPYRLLKFSVLGERSQSGHINYLGIGESATVILVDQGGEMRLLTNGLPESSIQVKGSRTGKFHLASWLSMLPVLVNPDAQDMLIVGLGAGLTLKAVPASIKNIDVVELEQEVINANKSASKWRGVDPLLDGRLKLHNNDARNALRNSTQMFDIIVSQPSHPWTAGASSLYTQEFFSLVKKRLRNKGVFIQWIGMRFIDVELLKSLLATLNKEFSNVELYQPLSKGGLMFVSSNQAINLSAEKFESPKNKEKWQLLGINNINQIMISKRLDANDTKKMTVHSTLSTDYFNILKLRSPKVIKTSMNKHQLNVLLAEVDPLIEKINKQPFVIIRRLLREKDYHRIKLLIKHINDGLSKRVALALLADSQNQNRNRQANIVLIDLLKEIQSNHLPGHQREMDEILFYLVSRDIIVLINRNGSPQLQAVVETVPLAQRLVNAWRLSKLNKWQKLAQLEPLLASLKSSHPAYAIAIKLRILWRVHSNDTQQHIIALKLIDNHLAINKDFNLLIQRTEIGIKLNNYDIAIASLYELLSLVPQTKINNGKPFILILLNKIITKAQSHNDYSVELKHHVANLQKRLQ